MTTIYTKRPAANRPAARLAWDNFVHMRNGPPSRMWRYRWVDDTFKWRAEYPNGFEDIDAELIRRHLTAGGAA